jgi:hypothetical protein
MYRWDPEIKLCLVYICLHVLSLSDETDSRKGKVSNFGLSICDNARQRISFAPKLFFLRSAKGNLSYRGQEIVVN